jgi:hypothetical protein
MKTEIYYSFEDDVEMKVGISSEAEVFSCVTSQGYVANANNVVMTFNRNRVVEMSDYFLKLSLELFKLKGLDNADIK